MSSKSWPYLYFGVGIFPRSVVFPEHFMSFARDSSPLEIKLELILISAEKV